MKCPKCGNEDTGAYCSNCGAPLIQENNTNTGKRTAVILIIVIAILAIVAIALWTSDIVRPAGDGGFSGNDREGVSLSSYQPISETVYDRNGISIEILGIDTLEREDFVLTVLFKNDTNGNINFDVRQIAVNGYVFDVYEWINVGKRSSVEHELRSDYIFGYEYLRPSVIDKLDIRTVEIMSENYDTIDIVPVKEIEYFQTHDFVINENNSNTDDSEFALLYENENISIRMIKGGKNIYDEYVAVLAVENKTDKEIICWIEDAFMNDIALGSSSYIYVSPGSKTIENMWLSVGDQEDINFNLRFNFKAYESASSFVIAEGTTEQYP